MMRINLLILFFILFYELRATERGESYPSSIGPVTFVENKNQWDSRVIYKADISGGSLYLEKNGFTFDFIDKESYKKLRGHNAPSSVEAQVLKGHCLKTSFVNSNALVSFSGIEKRATYNNYFQGNDKTKWVGNVPGFGKINYNNIYENIDLSVYSNHSYLKYDFIIKPGGDPAKVIIEYEGADLLELKNEHLIIKTSINEITEHKPYAYQIVEGVTKEIPCNYILDGNRLSYHFSEGYDPYIELVIDPVLIFSTYSGSTSDNFGYTATFDSKGFLYSGSTAFGAQYPVTAGAYDVSFNGGNVDIVISKYDTSGTSMIYSTYLGGSSDELPHSLIVNSLDELFIYGTTGSSNFPVTTAAYDITFNGGPALNLISGLGVNFPDGTDMIVSRMSKDGTQLLASTFIGGTKNDGINFTSTTASNNILRYNYADEVRGEIEIDAQNNVYIVSCTRSSDFPAVGNSFQPLYGGGDLDGTVVKMDNDLTSIIWSSFIGGSKHDAGYSLAIDRNNDLYIAGGTSSLDFFVKSSSLQGVFQGGRSDGFIIHVSSNGQIVLESTYYGSPAYDQVYFVEVDKQNEVYVFGQTEAPGNTFIFNAAYSRSGSGQFVSKIASGLDSLIFSTAFGTGSGGPNISPTAFLVDICNKIYIAGWGGGANQLGSNNAGHTTGMDVTADAHQTTTDSSDFYLMVLEDDASALIYATFFGGSQSMEHVDGGTSRFDRKGKIYQSVCAGCGGNSDFPIRPDPGAVSKTNNSSNCNNAVFKMDFDMPVTVADFVAPPPGCVPDTVQFSNNSLGTNSVTYYWDFGDGSTSTNKNPQHIYTLPGIFNVKLITYDAASCNLSDTLQLQIYMLSDTSHALEPILKCTPSGAMQIGIPPPNDPVVTFHWSPSTDLSDTTISNPYADPDETTTYKLVVSNGDCTDTIYQEVIVDGVLIRANDAEICLGDTVAISAESLVTGQQFTYSWKPLSFIISGADSSTALVSPDNTMEYTVTATNSKGCKAIINVTVTVVSFNDIAASASKDTIAYGASVLLQATPSTGFSYQWSPETGLDNSQISNPTATPLETTTYTVTVSDGNCSSKDSVTVYITEYICEDPYIYVPNAFTPNNDNNNDILFVRGKYIDKLYLTIYNRWGEKVFETKDQTLGWDGVYKGLEVDPGVFVYYLTVKCFDGQEYFRKGNITLIR